MLLVYTSIHAYRTTWYTKTARFPGTSQTHSSGYPLQIGQSNLGTERGHTCTAASVMLACTAQQFVSINRSAAGLAIAQFEGRTLARSTVRLAMMVRSIVRKGCVIEVTWSTIK